MVITVSQGASPKIGDKPHLCSVRAFHRVARRFVALVGIDSIHQPLGIFASPNSATPEAITSAQIDPIMQGLAATAYNLDPSKPTDSKHLSRWTSHSLRVGACTLLHALGFTSTHMKNLLRRRSDCFMEYLCNPGFLAQKQSDAIAYAADMPHLF